MLEYNLALIVGNDDCLLKKVSEKISENLQIKTLRLLNENFLFDVLSDNFFDMVFVDANFQPKNKNQKPFNDLYFLKIYQSWMASGVYAKYLHEEIFPRYIPIFIFDMGEAFIEHRRNLIKNLDNTFYTKLKENTLGVYMRTFVFNQLPKVIL